METLTQKQLLALISELWVITEQDPDLDILESFAIIIGGTTVSISGYTVGPDNMGHTIWLVVIHKPKYKLTNEQVCQIMDEGNHCISNGSIIYEADYAYVTWSNLGHI